MAFTAEDKKLYAGWFGEDEEDEQQREGGSDDDMDADAGQQRRSKRSRLGEFADLESSSEEGQDSEGDEEVGEGVHAPEPTHAPTAAARDSFWGRPASTQLCRSVQLRGWLSAEAQPCMGGVAWCVLTTWQSAAQCG